MDEIEPLATNCDMQPSGTTELRVAGGPWDWVDIGSIALLEARIGMLMNAVCKAHGLIGHDPKEAVA